MKWNQREKIGMWRISDMSHPDYKNIGSPTMRIIEECGEIIKAAMKGERFGWLNYHPQKPEIKNIEKINMELKDLQEAIEDLNKSIDKDKCASKS